MPSSRELITEYAVRPNKALGQNFLIDEAAIDLIVSAAAEPGLPVLEIGPGLGALTFPLAGTGLKLAAVELDKAMCEILLPRLPENARLINSDFLKADLGSLHSLLGGGEITAAGNLPYYITSPICMRLITCGLPIRRMVLMMQDEAAARFTARPKDRNYVPLSVLAQLSFDVRTLTELSPSSYYPQPEVSSRVLVFDRRNVELPDGLPGFLKCVFAARRKTLVNNLSGFGIGKNAAHALLESACIPLSARAEELSPEQLLALAELC